MGAARPRHRPRPGGLSPALALALLAAVAWWWLVPTYPNYDAYFHLVWGRELLDGRLPSFEAYAAPTPHPLELAVATVLGLSAAGDRLVVLVCLLALVALVWGTWRLGRALFGAWPAALAAVFVGSSFAFLLYAVRGYVDVPFLALVVWAAVREVEGPGGRAAPALLALAGLLRPEAWLLAGLLWLRHRTRAHLAAALVAPVTWALVDLVVTGDPLHSVRATSELAAELGRDRGIARVPAAFVSFLADVARPPVALAGVLGIVLAVRRFGAARMAVPLALAGAGVLTYLGTGLAGLSILPRYLTVPAVALCLFAGYAVARLASRDRRLAALAALVAVAFVALRLPSFATLAGELRFIRDANRDLAALLATPEVRAGLRCGPLSFPTYKFVPEARFELDAPPGRVVARSAVRPASGVLVVVEGVKTRGRYGFADGVSRATNRPSPGFAPAVRRPRFSAYVACPAAARPSASPSARSRSHSGALSASALWASAHARSS